MAGGAAGPVVDLRPDFVEDVRMVAQALLERWKLVALCVVAAILCALAYIWVTVPVYSSTVDILIDPRQQDVFEQRIVSSGMGQSSLGADTFLLDSQIEVIRSRSVLNRVIERTGLAEDPGFVGEGEAGILGSVIGLAKRVIRGPNGTDDRALTPHEAALDYLGEELEVFRRGNTYVIGVTIRSEDAEQAARIVNSVAEVYVEEIGALTRAQISEVEDLLGGRLDELREAAMESQMRVEAYRSENGLVGSDQLTIIEQQLRDLNEQLSDAAGETSRARVRWNEVAGLRGQPAETVLASGSLDSPLLNALRQQYSALASREASVLASLGARHPSVRAMRDGKASLQAEIMGEAERLISRYEDDYDVAQASELSLRERVAELEAATATSNRAGIELRDLERQAEADSLIYQQFLNRSRDAREQVNLPAEAVRVISPGVAGAQPVWPRELLILAAGIAAGGLLGLVLALLVHVFSPRAAARPAPGPIAAPVRSLTDLPLRAGNQ